MRLQLGVPVVRAQDVQQPRVLEQHHAHPVEGVVVSARIGRSLIAPWPLQAGADSIEMRRYVGLQT
jgi:hypothetical protein